MNDSPPTAEAAAPKEAPREEAPLDAEESWLEHAEELPARPRRRILAPLPVALLLALALACGFIAGVLVQKGQGGPSSGGSGFAGLRAAGFGGTRALRGGGSATGSGAASGLGSGSTSGSGPSPAFVGGPGAGGGGTGGVTIGQVAYVSGETLYVTTPEGNTVKVSAAPGSKVTKTVETRVKGIHPGETVVVSGATNANGSISAQTIRAQGAGGFGGGALFGGGAGGAGGPSSVGGARGGGSSGASTGGDPALFGKE